MFKKLVSNLPFNPSLIDQVSFYAKRMHRESRIRGVGFVFLILAMLVQIFAVVSPPQATLAAGDNDLIRGGFTSKSQAVNDCLGNTQNYKTILAYFNVSCGDVANTSITTIKSTDYGRQLYSMGRIPYGKTGEVGVQIQGKVYYMRYLWSWDSHAYSSYKALVGKNSKGATFILLYGCGNLVIIGAPKPPQPTDVCDNIPGIQTDKKQCDVCINLGGIQTTLQECDVCKNLPGIQTKLEDCDVCKDLPGIQLSKSECIPCKEAQNSSDADVCIVRQKSAQNITQNISNADGTTAKPNDQILYTLTATNSGKIAREFAIKEDLTDVLEYADVTDAHGGTFDVSTKQVIWPSVHLAPNQSTQSQLTVTVKKVIPKTPRSVSNPGSYDLVMNNVYGNAINIKLPKSVTKRTEQVNQALPNTGPGSSIAIAFGLTVLVGYFFARSRLMSKELDVIKSDFSSGGGM